MPEVLYLSYYYEHTEEKEKLVLHIINSYLCYVRIWHKPIKVCVILVKMGRTIP